MDNFTTAKKRKQLPLLQSENCYKFTIWLNMAHYAFRTMFIGGEDHITGQREPYAYHLVLLCG